MVIAHPHSRLIWGWQKLGCLAIQGQHHEGVSLQAPAPAKSSVRCMSLQDSPSSQADSPDACRRHGSVLL